MCARSEHKEFNSNWNKSSGIETFVPSENKNAAEVDTASAPGKVSHSQLPLVQRKSNFDVKINKVNGL